jgi:periplasmic divalent cation tolerance protein
MSAESLLPAGPLVLVLSTFSDAAQARQIGTALIERQLAACVNFLPGILSIYRWEGQIHQEEETLAIFKTRGALLPEFEAALSTLHPYSTPEFIVLAAEAASSAYLAWVESATAAPSH